MENQPNQQPNQTQGRQIQIKDGLAGGEYANFMQISHNKEEVLLVFGNVIPPTGRVVGKIITSPGHLKRMIAALQENIKKYEERFGPVTEADSPKDEIGFKTN